MAAIEQVSSPIKKLTKNKNAILFAGLGVGAGLIVLVMRSLSGSSSSTTSDSTTVASGDQSVSALGSQMQAFAQATEAQNSSIVAKLTAAEQENDVLTGELKSVKDAATASQTDLLTKLASAESAVQQAVQASNSATAGLSSQLEAEKQAASAAQAASDSKFQVLAGQNASIVSQLVDLQTKQTEPSLPVKPVEPAVKPVTIAIPSNLVLARDAYISNITPEQKAQTEAQLVGTGVTYEQVTKWATNPDETQFNQFMDQFQAFNAAKAASQ